MRADELYAMLYFSGIALVFALGMVLVQAVFIDVESRFGRWLMPMVLPLMVLSMMAGVVLGGRNLKYASQDVRTIGGNHGDGGPVQRMITVLLLGILFSKILGSLVRTRRQATRSSLRAGVVDWSKQALEAARRAGLAKALFISFVAFFLGNVVLPSAFGAKPTFLHNALYPIVLFTGIYLARNEPLEPLLTGAKIILLLMMVGSLALAAVKPDMAVQSNYVTGWLPGLKVRLWGLGTNANSIGPLALTLLLIEALQPSRRLVWRTILWGAGLVVLLLAQSKTAWASGFIVALLVFGYRGGRSPNGGLRIGFVLFLIGLMVVAALSLMFIDVDRIIAKLDMTQAGADFVTLSGRAQIWAAAIGVWQDSPAFGYGLLAWGPEHRAILGMPFAFHAHNQFFQSLSVGGVFGALSFVAYFVLMIVASFRAAPRTRGISLAMMALMTLRCIAEAPLELDGLTSGEIVMHALLFMVLVNCAQAMRQPKSQERVA